MKSKIYGFLWLVSMFVCMGFVEADNWIFFAASVVLFLVLGIMFAIEANLEDKRNDWKRRYEKR